MPADLRMVAALVLGTLGARTAPSQTGTTPGTTPGTTAPPACLATRLALGLDAREGATGGVRHDGVRLVLRNLGPGACRMPGLPPLRLEDAAHRPLPASRRAPPGMHPGPVVPPVVVAEGGRLTAVLRWMTDDTATAGTCVDAATLVVPVGGEALRAALDARLCAPEGGAVTFTQTPLRRDPAPAAPQAPAGP